MTYRRDIDALEAMRSQRPVHRPYTVSTRLDGQTYDALCEIEQHYRAATPCLDRGQRSQVIRAAILQLHGALGLSRGEQHEMVI